MKKAIVFKNVRKNFKQLKAVDGISMSIEQGEFFGLLGPNGAGKSTLINMMAGLVRPSHGSISVMGFDVNKDYQKARHSVGIVPQELVFDPFFNVREMLRFQAGYFGKDKSNDRWVDEIIERLDLADKASTNMRMLSGGMKRRALIAQALVHRPPVIVLDEPTAGVDVELRQRLWGFIKDLNKEGHTIVLTTHYLEEAETLCNRVAMMKSGKIVALNSTKNLLKEFSSKNLKVRLQKNKIQKIATLMKGDSLELEDDWCTFKLKKISDASRIIEKLNVLKIQILDMELIESDLENIFLKLTSKD
ncbi:MAG: ABC transporter ATP-binding protein [Nitrosomonadales bacterium]|jgi:ABC-2 type transport system ATP-binding protein|nr:ABC transporter ATP-binding protein [Nitrosomonadales bacterium]MBT4570938.1 ABC transporter ATP-binding protein [Nitrosomonadales bacterium]MBT4758917.1 ABC transporter ATP-binding protein [Nitrosomonadales bacterium]MBT6818515.1 ABC transporter ATP-binding protein [Nitrosomonadales bacterium]MBT7120267.1 ABC transporter ATP-binding protein [Nitrosomonadales bacterium]